ncbi:alpha/beta hydrolase [Leptospira stimsonii]|uniref:Alpha/beta hydrolase n=1 Tax=Leptospira stimsonii TaxID=2202203 RepID=A0A396Z6L4_9LEPT|nr:alpha/beta fold hydrolase [Leptospira stimsonii]RHX89336.1 alpha/beta hydrolase [Leptospira stimsonii]
MKKLFIYQIIIMLFIGLVNNADSESETQKNIILQEQGSFAVGGTVFVEPGKFDPIKHGVFDPAGPQSVGQTRHGDHAYVFYQIPTGARKHPIVFWHGYGQSAKTWETTPDGREGFQNIFLCRGFPVYLMDQPGRGRAAKANRGTAITAAADEQLWFGIFRLGVWPNFYEGVSFSRKPEALNQFFRQAVPDAGPGFQSDLYVDATSALFDRIGNAILVTHSASGGLGWKLALKNKNIRAIVSYEPGGGFIFPEGENVEPIKLGARVLQPIFVPKAEFIKFTKIPIVLYYGDNIPDKPSENPGKEQWRVFLTMAKQWAEVVNRYGGDVTVVHLPSIGINGNTHFPFSDLNNVQIADLMSEFLNRKGLDWTDESD